MDIKLNTHFPTPSEQISVNKPSTPHAKSSSTEYAPRTESASATPTQTEEAVQQVEEIASSEQVKEAIQDINKNLQFLSVDIEFSQDPDTNTTIIQVKDKNTQDVIRQIPSETVLEISKTLDEIQGMLINEEA